MKTFIKTVMAVSILAGSMGASATASPANDIAQRLQNVYSSFESNFSTVDSNGFTNGGSAVKSYGRLLYMIDAEDDFVIVDGTPVTVGVNDGNYLYADTTGAEASINRNDGESFGVDEIEDQVNLFVNNVTTDLFGVNDYSISGDAGDQTAIRSRAVNLQGGVGSGGIATASVVAVVDAANLVNRNLATNTDEDLATFHATFATESGRFNSAVAALGDVSSSLEVANGNGYSAFDLATTFHLGDNELTVNGINSQLLDPAGIGLDPANAGDVYTNFILTGALNTAAYVEGGGGIGYTTTVVNVLDDAGDYTGVVVETKTYDQGRTITTTYNADGTLESVIDSQG